MPLPQGSGAGGNPKKDDKPIKKDDDPIKTGDPKGKGKGKGKNKIQVPQDCTIKMPDSNRPICYEIQCGGL